MGRAEGGGRGLFQEEAGAMVRRRMEASALGFRGAGPQGVSG